MNSRRSLGAERYNQTELRFDYLARKALFIAKGLYKMEHKEIQEETKEIQDKRDELLWNDQFCQSPGWDSAKKQAIYVDQ